MAATTPAPGGLQTADEVETSVFLPVVILIGCLLFAASPVIYGWFQGTTNELGAKNLTWLAAGFSLLLTNISLEQLHGANQGAFAQGDMASANWESQASLAMLLSALFMVPVYTAWIPNSTNVSSILTRVFGQNTRTIVDCMNLVFMMINGSFALFCGVDNLSSIMFRTLKEDEYQWERYAGIGMVLLTLSGWVASNGGTKGVANSDIISGSCLFALSGCLMYGAMSDPNVRGVDLNRPFFNAEVRPTTFASGRADKEKDNKTEKELPCETYPSDCVGVEDDCGLPANSCSWKYWEAHYSVEGKVAEIEDKGTSFWPSNSGNKGYNNMNPRQFGGTMMVGLFYWLFNPAMALRVTSTRSPSHARRALFFVAVVKLAGFCFLSIPGLSVASLLKRGHLAADASTGQFPMQQSKYTLATVLNEYKGVTPFFMAGTLGMSILSTMNSQINAVVELLCDKHGVINSIGPLRVGCRSLEDMSSGMGIQVKHWVALIAGIVYFGFSIVMKSFASGNFFQVLQETQSIPQVFILIAMVSAIIWIWRNRTPGDVSFLLQDPSMDPGTAKRSKVFLVTGFTIFVVYGSISGALRFLGLPTVEMLYKSVTAAEGDEEWKKDADTPGYLYVLNCYLFFVVAGVGIVSLLLKKSSSSLKTRQPAAKRVSMFKNCEIYAIVATTGVLVMYGWQLWKFGQDWDTMAHNHVTEDGKTLGELFGTKYANSTPLEVAADRYAKWGLYKWLAAWAVLLVTLVCFFVRQDSEEFESLSLLFGSRLNRAVFRLKSFYAEEHREEAVRMAVKLLKSSGLASADAKLEPHWIMFEQAEMAELKFEISVDKKTWDGLKEKTSNMVSTVTDNGFQVSLISFRVGDEAVPLREATSGPVSQSSGMPRFGELNPAGIQLIDM